MSRKDLLARPQPRPLSRRSQRPALGLTVPQASMQLGAGLCAAALLGFSNRFPPTDRVTLHIRYFLSKTSDDTAAPALGRGCSQRSNGSTWKILGRTPVALTEVPFLPQLPEELDSNPAPASGEAGWIQPQTCSNHTLAAACPDPSGPPPQPEPSGDTNSD